MTPQQLRTETIALAEWFEARNISALDSIIVMAALIPATLKTTVPSMKDGGQAVAKLILDNVAAAAREHH